MVRHRRSWRVNSTGKDRVRRDRYPGAPARAAVVTAPLAPLAGDERQEGVLQAAAGRRSAGAPVISATGPAATRRPWFITTT